MDKLNKLRLLAGVPVKYTPSAKPSKLTEARTVPARKTDLAPMTEETMKARAALMNTAAMHVAKAIEALEKIPAVNFMGDVPHLVAELSSLLDGEDSAGGEGGMKELVAMYQTEYRSWKRKTNALARSQQQEPAVAESIEFDELDDRVPEDPREFADKSADLDAMAYGEMGDEGEGEGKTSPEVAAEIDAYAREAGLDVDGAEGMGDDAVGDDEALGDVELDLDAPVEDEFGDGELGDEEFDPRDGDEFDGGVAGDQDEFADLEDEDMVQHSTNFDPADEYPMESAQIVDKDESPHQLKALEPSPGDHDRKVNVPASLKQQLRAEAAQARKEAKELGVADKDAKWFYEALANMFDELLGHLEKGTVYDIKMAQIFMTSLMGPMLHKIPADVVNFVAKGGAERKLADYMKPVDKKYPVTGKMYKGE